MVNHSVPNTTAQGAVGDPRPIPILLYHSLSDEATASYRPWAVRPRAFVEQMEFLAAAGYTTLTVSGLVAALDGQPSALPEKPLVLTFDDGFADLHSVALPILDRLGLRATAYLVSDGIGGTSGWLDADGEGERPLLAWTQVRELHAHGIEIGSHSRTHRQLDILGSAEATDEIRGSQAVIEDALGAAVTSFAYPHGYHSSAVKRVVRAAGFTSACGVKHALSHARDDRWGLGRVIVYSDTSLEQFASWVRGEGLPSSWRRERPQTIAWRWTRRARARLVSGRPAPLRSGGEAPDR
jgi:peptidoglycan/xylan/chitin deacetylase (PgdA/CDA1 family)